jgi:hypothetical protein
MSIDSRLKEIDEAKRELIAEFRRQMSTLLDREDELLGMVQKQHHDIEIYY